MRRIIAVVCVALTACGGGESTVRPTEPRVEYRVVEKDRPVPCFTADERPAAPLYTFKSEAEIDAATPKQVAEGLRADRLADEQYMRAIEALFVKCQQAKGVEPK